MALLAHLWGAPCCKGRTNPMRIKKAACLCHTRGFHRYEIKSLPITREHLGHLLPDRPSVVARNAA
jgi:hypothetical protein